MQLSLETVTNYNLNFSAVSKMQERHDILWNSIGYLPEEQEALDTGIMIRNGSLTAVIVGSLMETGFFYLYNGMFHPLANILKDPETEGN